LKAKKGYTFVYITIKGANYPEQFVIDEDSIDDFIQQIMKNGAGIYWFENGGVKVEEISCIHWDNLEDFVEKEEE
jgi:hypothetical protein